MVAASKLYCFLTTLVKYSISVYKTVGFPLQIQIRQRVNQDLGKTDVTNENITVAEANSHNDNRSTNVADTSQDIGINVYEGIIKKI